MAHLVRTATKTLQKQGDGEAGRMADFHAVHEDRNSHVPWQTSVLTGTVSSFNGAGIYFLHERMSHFFQNGMILPIIYCKLLRPIL